MNDLLTLRLLCKILQNQLEVIDEGLGDQKDSTSQDPEVILCQLRAWATYLLDISAGVDPTKAYEDYCRAFEACDG